MQTSPITTIKLGHGLVKYVDISLETLLNGCIDMLNETEEIKNQFRKEFPHLF